MIVAVGVTTGAAQRAFARELDGKRGDVPGQDPAPGRENAFQTFHFFTISRLRADAAVIDNASTPFSAERRERRSKPSVVAWCEDASKCVPTESSASKWRRSTPTTRTREFPNKIG